MLKNDKIYHISKFDKLPYLNCMQSEQGQYN